MRARNVMVRVPRTSSLGKSSQMSWLPAGVRGEYLPKEGLVDRDDHGAQRLDIPVEPVELAGIGDACILVPYDKALVLLALRYPWSPFQGVLLFQREGLVAVPKARVVLEGDPNMGEHVVVQILQLDGTAYVGECFVMVVVGAWEAGGELHAEVLVVAKIVLRLTIFSKSRLRSSLLCWTSPMMR